jgi:hypothetical protein
MKKLGKYNNEQRCRRWCIVIMQTKAASETKEHSACGWSEKNGVIADTKLQVEELAIYVNLKVCLIIKR